jgi:hypothetical protein
MLNIGIVFIWMAPNSNFHPENGYIDCGFNVLVIYAARALTLTRTIKKKRVFYIVVLWDMTSCSLEQIT